MVEPVLIAITSPVVTGVLMIVAAVLLGSTAIVSLVRRDRGRHGPTTRRFCRALGVSASERRLLTRLARSIGARGVVSVLLSRGCFDEASAVAQVSRPDERRLAAIRRRVFE